MKSSWKPPMMSRVAALFALMLVAASRTEVDELSNGKLPYQRRAADPTSHTANAQMNADEFKAFLFGNLNKFSLDVSRQVPDRSASYSFARCVPAPLKSFTNVLLAFVMH